MLSGGLAAGVAWCVLTGSASSAGAEDARLLVSGKWRTVSAQTVGDVKGYRRGSETVRLSRFGGWADKRVKKTGFFHTRKIDGRWWLVDPDGCLFVSVGLCSVINRSVLDQDVFKRKFGDNTTWAIQTATLLQGAGFNSLGCWSDWRAFRATARTMPYFPRWNFMSTYKNRRDRKYGARGYPNECMPVFDPAFETFCDTHAKQLAATRDDPYLVGHFSDNELPFRPDLLEYYLKLPKSDPGYKAAAAWFAKRKGRDSRRTMSRTDKEAFLEYTANRYYSIVGAAIRKYDPNHLYVGSRIHGRTICPAMFKGSTSLDVVSVNYYHRWSAERERMGKWVKLSGRPFLVSEWYAQSLESASTKASGAGFRVKTDRGRGLFYQNLALGLLKQGGCVGWHWFKYSGDEKGFHKGLVNAKFVPHTDMLNVMRDLNRNVYPLAKHFRR